MKNCGMIEGSTGYVCGLVQDEDATAVARHMLEDMAYDAGWELEEVSLGESHKGYAVDEVPMDCELDSKGGVEAAPADSKSLAPRRAYHTAWAAWAAFADARGLADLPAEPGGVAAYLVQRHQVGATMATIRMATAAIGSVAATGGRGCLGPASDRPSRYVREESARL